MSLYRYVKSKKNPPMRRSVLISLFFIAVGGGMLSWVAWPIVSFRILSTPLLADVISPLAGKKQELRNEVVYAKDNAPDFTNANVWFPSKPQQKIVPKVNAYRLSIPKLGISNAMVVIGGDDLSKSLVHYGGTALPGENGNGAIFGHSVLPQFFNPSNYKTIFSTLPTLAIGDEIFVTYDQVIYKYRVENLKIKEPEDISVLDQQYDDSYITLVTCVPPGTYWQRLNVRARLVKL